MVKIILFLLTAAMSADHYGSTTWRTADCRGCCPVQSADGTHGGFSRCSTCDMTGHVPSCPGYTRARRGW